MTTGSRDGITLAPDPRPDFVETELLSQLTRRALRYLRSGYPVHFRGPAGTGKSSLAMHVAAKLGRPIVLILGDEDFGSTNLIGSEKGVRHRKVVDEYIRSVTKTEDTVTRMWIDSRFTSAIKNGYTLVYDEYTRSRPEANNPLLTILEERLLTMPPDAGGSHGYVPVHPDFSAIFTSNPEEYAGVHKSQDALQDRMITLDIEGFDIETESAIACRKSGLDASDAEFLVRLVRRVQELTGARSFPSLRSSIRLARIVERSDLAIDPSVPDFVDTLVDILVSEARRRGGPEMAGLVRQSVNDALRAGFEAPAEAESSGKAARTPTAAGEAINGTRPEPKPKDLTINDFQRFLAPVR